jgi:uncharacterized membrane protein
MASPAQVARHPIHPMLIVFPIGLWVFAFICYTVFMLGGGDVWRTVALYAMAGGIIGAALAAIPGMIDLLSMQPTRTRTIGIWHMILNISVLTLFAVSFGLQIAAVATNAVSYALALIAVLLLLVSGWLGGEMVYVHGSGTQQCDEAHGFRAAGQEPLARA